MSYEMLGEPRKASKPSPAPHHCHHRLRTRPTGGHMINNGTQQQTPTRLPPDKPTTGGITQSLNF